MIEWKQEIVGGGAKWEWDLMGDVKEDVEALDQLANH